MAQAIRASLLASAMAATLVGQRREPGPMLSAMELGIADHRQRPGREQATQISCIAANIRQGLARGQFRVLACRVPFLQILRNQLPPQVGCETARPLLSSTAAGLPSSQLPDSSLLRR